MRFKTFLYHFIFVTFVIIIAVSSGYFSLRSVLYSSLKNKIHQKASFLTALLENPDKKGKEASVINDYGRTEEGYCWIADSKGRIIAYPEIQSQLAPQYYEIDKNQITALAAKDDTPAFIYGSEFERRMIFSEKLSDGNYLILSSPVKEEDKIAADYLSVAVLSGIFLFIFSFFMLIYLSGAALKPFTALQEYASNLVIGEYIDRASSLKDADVRALASVMEELYKSSCTPKPADQNPLTGLPGNKSLYDVLFKKIETGEPMAIGFADCNNFMAYVNKYGSEKGDLVVGFMGAVIIDAITEKGNKDDKIYHLGRDRFMFITTPEKVHQICEKIIADYDAGIYSYYDEEALKQGGIDSKDREGKTGKFPIMPICIGVATNTSRTLSHPLQIGHIVGEIRSHLRDLNRSSFLIDRRMIEREEEKSGEKAPFTQSEIELVRQEIKEKDGLQKIKGDVSGERADTDSR